MSTTETDVRIDPDRLNALLGQDVGVRPDLYRG
jgi:hypothetical protein